MQKKISKKIYYKCPWKIGDIFAYKVESDLACEHDLFGKYIIFQKASEYVYIEKYGKNTYPIVRCWISNSILNNNCIGKIKEFIRFDKIKDMDGSHNYAYVMYTTSKRVVPKKLIYIGNYDLIIPKDDRGNISECNSLIYWNYFGKKNYHL